MGKTRTLATPGQCGGVLSCPSVRSHLTACGAVASAGILAVGLVTAPPELPELNFARTEVRAVQLATFSLSPPAPSGGLLEQFLGNQARTVVPAAPAVKGGASDFTTAVAESPLTFGSASDPATDRQQVNNADLAATPTAFDLGAILGPLINNPIVGPVVLFGAIAFGFLVILPVEWFVQTVYGAIAGVLGLPPVLPLPGTITATAEADSTAAPILTRDSVSSDPVLATLAAAPADMAPAAKSGKADVSPPVTSIDKRTRTEQMTSTEPATENVQISTDTETPMTGVAETAEEDEAPTGPTAASAPEPSLSASTSKPAKPTLRPATPRPVVRGSLGVGEQLRDLPQRGNGGRPTTRTADAGDRAAAAAGASSVASSPAASRSTAGKSSGGDSSRGDAGDS